MSVYFDHPKHRIMHRRTFVKQSALLGGLALAPAALRAHTLAPMSFFQLSLAQWSLRHHHWKKTLDNLDFPDFTQKTFGIKGLEYVSQFFPDNAVDEAYAQKLLQRSRDAGMTNVLIMVDMFKEEGKLASPQKKVRKAAADNHKPWVDAAHILGCHAIRVNAYGYEQDATAEQAQADFVDGLGRLVEYGASVGISIVVENHGGHSSNGQWLAGVMQQVDSPYCGTLPDFGNFRISKDEQYDPYLGVEELMPYAKGVSAKSMAFDAQGNEAQVDYRRLMKIVKDAGYEGFVGIEWGGQGNIEEANEGIRQTQALLNTIAEEWE